MTYPAADVDRFAAGDDLPPESSPRNASMSGDMNEVEEAELRRMVVLLYKVLLLAGSEGHDIRRTRDKPTRAEGGKPGFKNRPNHERFIVEYLPRHRTERRKDAETQGRKHQFLGRRGCWRKLLHERFVNLHGTRIYVYPINGPDGKPPLRKRKFVLLTP